MDLHERYQGALLGLAAGDALGACVEYAERGSFPELEDIVGGGPHGLEPGEWTDDTSLTLCLAESLIERGGFDLADQAERYRLWYRKGHLSSNGRCFDIGEITRQALSRYELTRDPLSGIAHEMSAGNGCLPRVLGVVLAFRETPHEALPLAAESARVTHSSPDSVDSCRYFAGLLLGVLGGAPKSRLLHRMHSPIPGIWDREPLSPQVRDVTFGSFREADPPRIVASGHAVRTLEAALWAFHKSDTFRDGALLAANLGGEASTVAAVYGALAGAFYGRPGVPSSWRNRVALSETIETYAQRLYQLSVRGPAVYEIDEADAPTREELRELNRSAEASPTSSKPELEDERTR